MYCSKCGAPLADEAAFCQKCGSKVASAETSPMSENADCGNNAGKSASQPSADSDAAFKYKSKLCFFLALFPLILTFPLSGITGVMAIFCINLVIAVAFWVAGWFFFAKRHCLGAGATVAVTALFSFIGAYLVPIIPIWAWHVYHQRKIGIKKMPPANDHMPLAIVAQLGTAMYCFSAFSALSSLYYGVLAFLVSFGTNFLLVLPGYYAIQNAKKVVMLCESENDAGARKAAKIAKILSIISLALFVLGILGFGYARLKVARQSQYQYSALSEGSASPHA